MLAALGLPALLVACRPRQWPKNLLVFAAPLFAFRFEAGVWLPAAGALVAFCLISSAIYLLNDWLDVAADRAHPSKRHRPIAAGLVSVPAALTSAAVLAAVSLSLAAWITPALAGVVLLYGLIQVAYCLQLKRMPLLDLFCIASGFLLRAIAGAVAAMLPPSPWFLLTVGLLALFLAVEKRKAELRVAQDLGVMTRKALERHSLPLLLRLESLVATSAFITYALWAAGPALRARDCCQVSRPTRSSPWGMPGWRCSSRRCRATSSAQPASSWPGPTARSSAKNLPADSSLLTGPRARSRSIAAPG
ncbi:MAG: decaprenyl-phosphate phosphoribosyltransferase [Cyanobium sp.]